MTKKFEIRNSTAEFLTFVAENKEDGVQVFYKDETIWATQQAIATLFDKNKSTISRHIANIYSEGELQPEATVAKFATVVNRGIRGEVVSSSVTASYRTDSSAATLTNCNWKVATCPSFRWRGCRRRGISNCRRINEICL